MDNLFLGFIAFGENFSQIKTTAGFLSGISTVPVSPFFRRKQKGTWARTVTLADSKNLTRTVGFNVE